MATLRVTSTTPLTIRLQPLADPWGRYGPAIIIADPATLAGIARTYLGWHGITPLDRFLQSWQGIALPALDAYTEGTP